LSDFGFTLALYNFTTGMSASGHGTISTSSDSCAQSSVTKPPTRYPDPIHWALGEQCLRRLPALRLCAGGGSPKYTTSGPNPGNAFQYTAANSITGLAPTHGLGTHSSLPAGPVLKITIPGLSDDVYVDSAFFSFGTDRG
jgi:hypothetical protein